MKETIFEKAKTMLSGETLISKREICLIGTCCLLAGIILGFLTAPLTHGIRIGCNNGSGNTGNSSTVHNIRELGTAGKKKECCKKENEN